MQNPDPLESILLEDDFLQEIAQDPKYKVQVIYSPIQRDSSGKASFQRYSHGLNTDSYFYPASTVKLPVALLALERLNELAIPGLDMNSPMLTYAGTVPQTAALQDSSKADYLPSVAHYIKKVLLVSDNDAFNRLYEFLGQGYINQKLREKGFLHTRIIHRLSVGGFDTLGNRKLNPIEFRNGDEVIYKLPERYAADYADLGLKDQLQGKAYMSKGERIDAPMDFTYKNYLSLEDLHDMVKAIFFPESMPEGKTFALKDSGYDFIREYMGKLPRESKEPAYPEFEDWDNYVKFLGFGGEKTAIPSHLRIYNKIGLAYGFLIDAGYFVDSKTGREFLLAATILVNENETFNDNTYEYDAVGFEFMKRLGQAVLKLEN